MVDVANENGFNTSIDDFNKNKLCAVFVPYGDEELWIYGRSRLYLMIMTQYMNMIILKYIQDIKIFQNLNWQVAW